MVKRSSIVTSRTARSLTHNNIIRSTPQALVSLLNVQYIPMLVFIRSDGTVITEDGILVVELDPHANAFPPLAA